MASPFPGTDPFLEAPARWSGVHHHLLSAIAESLGDALAPTFIVAIEERVYVATPGDLLCMPWIQPDVFVEEVRERFLEILDVESRVVVATIEVLSPTNKAPGTTGRDKFLDKRRRVLAAQTHWIEIDLLRAGERPPEVQGRGDYYALLHRRTSGSAYEVWVADLRQRLPVIGVPTRSPLPDTPLDLQAIVDTAYRRGHYDIAIAYDAPVPAPPLRADDDSWAAERFAAWRA